VGVLGGEQLRGIADCQLPIADWKTSHRFAQMNTDKTKDGLDCQN